MNKAFGHLNEIKHYLVADTSLIHQLSLDAEIEEKQRSFYVTTTSKEGHNLPGKLVTPWPPIPRCTIPLSLSLFSIVDFLGFLLKQNNDDYLETWSNFEAFFEAAFRYGVCAKIPKDQITLLNTCARQGMVHNYMPKLDLAVSYHSKNPDKELFFIEKETGDLTLNVNELKRVVLSAIDEVLKDTDQTVLKRMEDHFEKVNNDYSKQLTQLIQTVKNTL